MNTLRWLRVVGDTTFALGALAFVGAVVRATTKRTPSRRPSVHTVPAIEASHAP